MRRILVIALIAISTHLVGQEKIEVKEEDYTNYDVEMADGMRQDGKIYVVVTISSLVLLGLLGYAFHIDRRITILENKISSSEHSKSSS